MSGLCESSIDSVKMFFEGREPIKVYLRLKPTGPAKGGKVVHTEVTTEILPFDTVKLSPHFDCQCNLCKKSKQLEAKQQYAVARSLKSEKTYQFDKVYSGTATQEDLYAAFDPYIDGCIEGYTSTILTYGPANGGKSYTLIGTHEHPGVVPRAFMKAFDNLNAIKAADPQNLAEVEVSYVEFINNTFVNLLKSRAADSKDVTYLGSQAFTEPHPEADLTDLDILNVLTHTQESMVIVHTEKIDVRENRDVGVFLSGPKLRIPIRSAKQGLAMLKWADGQRDKAYAADDVKNRFDFLFNDILICS